jgi:hypothetical protein
MRRLQTALLRYAPDVQTRLIGDGTADTLFAERRNNEDLKDTILRPVMIQLSTNRQKQKQRWFTSYAQP